MIAQEQRELKNKWQLERNELESGILQLTAQQTQLVGTIRKKDAAFERLQAYLQKSQSASQRPAPVPSSTTAPVTAMATALVVVPNTSSVPVQSSANISVGQIGLVISKPLPSSSSQTQPVSIRDATIHSLTQLLKDSQVSYLISCLCYI